MKKIIAALLAVLLCLAFAGCGDKKDNESKAAHTVDVEYYAKIGEIPEHKYALGADSAQMKTDLDAEDKANEAESGDGHVHSVYSFMEMEDYSFLSYENASYYYKNDSDGKIGCIVSLDTSYDFPIGTMTVEIKEALSEFESEEKQGNSDILFFLPSSAAASYTYLEYQFDKNHVIFAFQDSSLCAVMIYNPENW